MPSDSEPLESVDVARLRSKNQEFVDNLFSGSHPFLS
jgi:hypothetical protein